MKFPRNDESGFVSFFALIALIATAFLGSGLYFIIKENIETERHHEIGVQLRYYAESAVEKIAYDIENQNLILPENIKDIDEYVVANENLFEIKDNNITIKAAIKYENNGIRIFAVTEKINEPYTVLGIAEGFMEEVEGVYKWKYWIKVK